MPTYVYRREDGSTFETQQRITEPALETCPTTGQKVKRVISSAGVIFKGSGFYQTDYVRKGGDGEGAEAKGENGKGEGAKKEGKKAEAKSDGEEKETSGAKGAGEAKAAPKASKAD